MNKVKPLDRQSLIDVALQTSGGVEGALGMSIKNDIPVSGELAPDVELETAPVVDKLVLGRYEAHPSGDRYVGGGLGVRALRGHRFYGD